MPIPEHILASALLRLAALEADGVDLAPELSDLLDHADDDTLQYRPQRRAGSSTAESSARVRSSARRLPAPSAMAPSPTPPFTPVALRCASDHADDTLQRPPQRRAGSTATFNSSSPLGSSVHRVPAPSAMASPPTPPSVPITPRRAYRHRHHAESQRRAQSLLLEGLPLSDKPARIANFDAVPLLRPVPSPMISSTQLSTLTPMQTPSPSASSSSLSTPTTLVNPTPPPKFFQVLPPLQLPISTDVDMGEPPSPLSPLESRSSSPSPSSPSPGSTALHKRVPADHTYGNEEGETEHEDQSNTEQQRKRPRIALKLPAGNGGGGGGGGGGGPGPAHLWTEECVRNGDRRRAGGDATIGAMPCQHGTCTSCDAPQQQAAGGGASGTSGGSTSAAVGPSGNAAGATMDMNVDVDAGENTGPRTRSATAGKGKKPAKSKKTAKTKREKGWCEDPNGGPPLTKAAGNFLSALLAVWNSKGRTDLETVLVGPRENASSDPLAAPLPDYDPTNTEASYTRVLHLIEDTQLLDLQTIMALIQLALNVDSEIHQAALNGHSLSKEAIGKRITKNSTSGNNFREHVGWGYRFAFLAAGGTLGIIPIIASLDLRTTVTRHMHCVDIDCVGTALREVCHGKWLPMVKRLMLPIAYVRSRTGYMQSFKLSYRPPAAKGESPKPIVVFGLNDHEKSDKIFDTLQTNTIKLQNRKIPPQFENCAYSFDGFPGRSSEWDSIPGTLPWNPMPDAGDIDLPTPITVTSPVKLGPVASKMPFKKKDRDTWTTKQRGLADNALKVTSISELQEKMNTVHKGGKCAGKYIEVNTSILNKEALFIRDQDDQFIALLFSVPDEFKESLRRAIDHLNTVLNGEFTDKDSRDKAFKYLSIHYDWYARMPPKGHDAPKDIHPNNLGKAHGARVNMRQRVPYESKETLDKPEEYARLADALTDFFTVISVSVAHLMPEDTKELKMYVDQLPLGASSPCYPFGGFVINIDSCTRAHRDPKDLRLCLIAHMGKHTGGQLGLYEVGLSFDLQLGDILVFPSWRLTHFNCHYEGKRATIVLHTDREAKSWTKDGHGWSTYIVNHHRQAEEEQAGAGVDSSSDDED